MRRLLTSCLLLALSLPASAAMQTRTVDWKIGAQEYSGVLVFDDASAEKRPGLVMVPNWMGVTPDAVEQAKRIAGDAYVVLVADVYGKGVRPKDAKQAGEIAGRLRADRVDLRARAGAAVDALKLQFADAPLDANRIGALGFCFGGSTALELVRGGSELAGVVSLHGGLSTPLPAKAGAARTPVLVLNGADDKGVTDDDIASFEKEMDAAGADWQFVDFSGAVHCFAEPSAGSDPASNCRYDVRAAKRAYAMLHDFFKERFAAR